MAVGQPSTRAASAREVRGEILDWERALKAGGPFTAPFDPFWQSGHWTKWATIREALRRLNIAPGASVLDVGIGEGWTSLFLAEAGYDVLGTDFAPAAVEIAQARARRWTTTNEPRFAVADMEQLELDMEFDLVLVFEALHHSTQRRRTVANLARHVKPGGWVLFGEPSVLHAISPHARRVQREQGWVETGIPVRGLKRDCRDCGLGNFRRFFEGTQPYESRVTEFAWQLARLAAANFFVAPRASVWLSAQKLR